MPEQRKYPPIDDPARYDRIVERGRSMRRRRQLGVGAGTGGSVAAVALAVVLITGGGGGADRSELVADGDAVDETTTTSTTTTTTTPPPPDELTVQVDATADRITVEVIDPELPVSDDSQQCVTVSLMGDTADSAEATGCDDIPAVDGVVTVDLPATGGVLIGCSAALEQPDPNASLDLDTELRATTFELTPPAGLAPGTYTVEVQVASGIGDGCHGTGDEAPVGEPLAPGATERSTSTTATIDIG